MVKGKRRKERKILPKSLILDEISDLKGEERIRTGNWIERSSDLLKFVYYYRGGF